MRSRFACLAGGLLVLTAAASCAETEPQDGLNTLGLYALCQTKVVDTCVDFDPAAADDAGSAADAGDDADAGTDAAADADAGTCAGLDADSTRKLSLAYGLADGLPHVRRIDAEPLAATVNGNRFVVTLPETSIDALCKCTMTARETLLVEVLPDVTPGTCADTSKEKDPTYSCLPDDDVATDADAWLAVADGEALSTNRLYATVRGRVVTELVPVDADCRCRACRVEYDFIGRR